MAKKSPFFWRATRAAKNPTKITHGPCASCRDRAGSSATRRLAARSDHGDELMHSCPRTRGPRLTGKKKRVKKKCATNWDDPSWPRKNLASCTHRDRLRTVRRMGSSAHHPGVPRREVAKKPIKSKTLCDLTQSEVDLTDSGQFRNKDEQIIGTRDKPQCLVVQRPLSHLQHPDATKSSTKDLSNAIFKITSSRKKSLSIINPLVKSAQGYYFSRNIAIGGQHCLVSMDSDLEAFSRNPTHGSFAAMSFQAAAFTNYAN